METSVVKMVRALVKRKFILAGLLVVIFCVGLFYNYISFTSSAERKLIFEPVNPAVYTGGDVGYYASLIEELVGLDTQIANIEGRVWSEILEELDAQIAPVKISYTPDFVLLEVSGGEPADYTAQLDLATNLLLNQVDTYRKQSIGDLALLFRDAVNRDIVYREEKLDFLASRLEDSDTNPEVVALEVEILALNFDESKLREIIDDLSIFPRHYPLRYTLETETSPHLVITKFTVIILLLASMISSILIVILAEFARISWRGLRENCTTKPNKYKSQK